MSGVFLSDGIQHAEDQKALEAKEIAAKKADNMVKVRAIDPMTNTMKNVWVKKDQPTLDMEEEDRRKAKLEDREAELARKSRMLDMINKEEELAKKEKEIAAMEKKIKSKDS